MTLFFDTKVQFLDADAISTTGRWHPLEPLFGIASYSQDRGGSVTLFDDTGEPLHEITFPVHSVSQATALCWHPERRLLVSGWENGEIHAWFNGNREFSAIHGPHKAPIVLMEFSELGGRFVTGDSVGVLTGWRCDTQGQFLTMFTHDLKETLLHATFRNTVSNPVATELSNLAKAAVAGDESALDVLTNWRPRTAARNLSHSGVKDNHCFYVGTQAGIIYYLNQSGTCMEVLRNEMAPVVQVLWHPKRDALITLMEDMTVGHYLVESTGALTELDRVKLSGRVPGHTGAISWAFNSLAIITGDFSVRIWDIDTSDNYLLPTSLPSSSSPQAPSAVGTVTSEVFTCIAYSSSNQTLCAGTNQGRLYTWKRLINQPMQPNVEQPLDGPINLWQLNNITAVRGAIKHCVWGCTDAMQPCVLLNCVTNVYVLKEQPLISTHTRSLWVTQKTSNRIQIQHAAGQSINFDTDIAITGLCLNESNMVVTNGRSIVVHRINRADVTAGLSVKVVGSFAAECCQVLLSDRAIVAVSQQDIKVFSLGGVVLQELHFSSTEGKPIGADLTGNFLTIFTLNGFIKLYDTARHEFKMVVPAKSGYDLFENFGEIIMAKSNVAGSHLAIAIASESLVPDGKLYIWDIQKDRVVHFNFRQSGDASRLPVAFFWDTDDIRLLACEARLAHAPSKMPIKQTELQANGKDVVGGGAVAEAIAAVMFVTDGNECACNVLETIGLVSGEQLVNLCAPHVITLTTSSIGLIPLRNFHGMEECDSQTRATIVDFSVHVAQGNMDQAFRCIRSLESAAVWTNLAKMCVTTGRLDVAKVCLGHLKKARCVRALRKAMEDTSLEHEAKVAILAIELGMNEEAEALYRKCNRFDLLNRLLQASGKFDEALKIAEQCDRVHLKMTYYKYAEWLKERGDVQKALSFFEKSTNPTHNITQALMGDPDVLRKHMQTTKDPNLLKWWAQYIESTGDMEMAMKIYEKADDHFSQVRILCFLGQLSKAEQIARNSNDKSVCYHLARHYENIGKIQEAIHFYTRAQTFSNAVRICKENDLQEDLWNVASSARPKDKAVAAAYFEEIEDYKKAVELYHRAGMLHKAVEMAFASQQPETLQVIASELDSSSDPELISRCADFFLSIEQPHKAVYLLANAKQFERALEISADRGVPITESLSEMLTPSKEELPDPTRTNVLMKLGDILQEQGDYHTATKKFTQSGDKMRAMKSLLKSGDTDKICFFAGMSRQKEVYIMAGNYLQALSWQSDPKVLKNIVTFYTKGQAYDLLANFYATCAHVEIEEFRDYDKALKALQEAGRCLSKVQNVQRAVDNLHSTMLDVRKVVDLQEAMENGENQTVIAGCRNMLMQLEKPPIRHCDIQALLIEAFISSKQYTEALTLLRELAKNVPDWSSRKLIERPLIEVLANGTGMDFESIWMSGRRQRADGEPDTHSDYEEEIQEEVD